MRINVRALGERQPEHPSLRRYREVAEIVTGNPEAQAIDGVEWVERLCNALGVPRLGAYGIKRDDFPVLVQRAAAASSMKANPVTLTPEELMEILERAL
jgi:alcohol dehydrogenase class IV